jgi:hypothetical protein
MRRTYLAAALGAASLTLALPAVATADPVTAGGPAPRHAGAPRPVAAKATGVVVGQIAALPTSCGSAFTLFMSAESGPPSFTIPSNGVLTTWSHLANATPGSARLVVVGPSAVPGHRTVLGTSALQPVAVNALNSFPTRIPVTAGTAIALQTTVPGMACVGATVVGDAVAGAAAPYDPATNVDLPNSVAQAGIRINVAAVLEPDADGDGYGDVSQDACPVSAQTQAVCPAPDTKIKKQPPRVGHNRFVTIKFKSTVPGSTFTCSVDGKKFKPCSSPFDKRLGLGRHKVKILATSGVGIVEAKPAVVKFRITR